MTVTKPKASRTILRRNGKCFMCLKGGHISTNCPSREKCFNCEVRHHVTICERIRNTLTSRNVVREEASPRGSGSCQDGSRDAATSATHISNNANSVLLQIAQAFVCRPDKEQLWLNAHVIFDSCSQRSYITSNAREKLNLPTIGKELFWSKHLEIIQPLLKNVMLCKCVSENWMEWMCISPHTLCQQFAALCPINSLKAHRNATPTYGVYNLHVIQVILSVLMCW